MGSSGVPVDSVLHAPTDGPTPLDVRRQRNRDSMRRARVRQRAERLEMQQRIRELENQLTQLIAASNGGSSGYGQLLLQTEQLRLEKRRLEGLLQQHEHFQRKIGLDVQEELEQWEGQQQEDDIPDEGAMADIAVPGRPEWMPVSAVQTLLQFATKMFLANAARTDELVTTSNLVLGWRDKRAVVEDTWAQFILTKAFPHQSTVALAERTWSATVNVAELRGMLKWTAGMKVLHRLSEHAYVVTRELHLPNSVDPDLPIRYRYELLIFRAETPNGFIISTQNIKWCGAADSTEAQMLDQRLLRLAGMPLVTMYGFLFERQYSEDTGEEMGCRVTLAGRTSDGSLSYAHKVLIEALPSILRWENTYVGPILCITSD